jgi:hypothetical protein
MTAFTRRGTTLPSNAELTAIEQLFEVDRTPTTPTTGIGTGTMLLVGEFEDGAFNTPTQVFGATDEATKFGGFGFTYGSLIHQNPCARLHLTENWNGNGFLKGKNLQPAQKVICRVDTSTGQVRFTLAAALRSSAAPFSLANGDQLSVTTDTGGPASSTAVIATVATVAGAGFAGTSGYAGGEQIGIQVDSLPEVIVSFQVGDQTPAQVVARINSFMGYTAAAVNGAEVDIVSIQLGSGASVTLRDLTTGALAAIGHVAGTTSPVGNNVANAAAVTAAEAANLINAAAITAVDGVAVVDAATQEVIVYRSGSASGTILIADVAGAMATDMGFTTGTTITANIGAAFPIPAGTRVRNSGGAEWVTMVTLSIPEGTASIPNDGTVDVKIRPATDDGTGTSEVAGNITVLVDAPASRYVEVTNPANVSAALTEPQMDSAYVTALVATESPTAISRFTTAMITARRSEAVVRQGRLTAQNASNEANYGRVYYTRSHLGSTSAAAILDVANWRSDHVAYSWLGWKQSIPEIAAVGLAGGTGFTADGVITIGADGPLAYLSTRLNPEENLGQDPNGLLDFLSGLEDTTEVLNRALYTALKAAGIMNPRIDQQGTLCYQSDVTTDLTPGRKTLKRRRMSFFIQDSLAAVGVRYSKKLATDARRAGYTADLDSFLSGLLSANAPENQRIGDYIVEDVSDNNPDQKALGIFTWEVQVQMLASLDTIVLDTQIGEGVNVTSVRS